MTKNTPTTQNKIIIITGASSGIGKAAARQLAATNTVVIVGRSPKTKDIAKELNVDYFRSDYSDLKSVRKLAADLLKKYPKIDLLVNNAGGAMSKIETTKDGFESTIQVNYYAQFLLTELLLSRLIESKGAIINTSSSAHFFSKLKIENLESAKSPIIAYGNAKLLDLIHAKEIARRYGKLGVNAVSFHPGVVATNFAARSGSTFGVMSGNLAKRILKTPDQGADTLVWLATNRDLWKDGTYYSKRKPARMNRFAKDTAKHKTIWDETEFILDLVERKK